MDSSNKMYIAIIGDLVDSKHISDRNVIQEKLKAILSTINDTYKEEISSKFMITLGDEFQGLLHSGKVVMDIIEIIAREIFPTRLRFGIGVGEILTSIEYEMPLGADGPAYYNARAVINRFKSVEKKKMTAKADIGIKTDNENNDSLINAIFTQSYFIKSKWTNRQREIINCYLALNEVQSDVALKLGINQSSVQRSLQHSGFYGYSQAVKSITVFLSEIGEENV